MASARAATAATARGPTVEDRSRLRRGCPFRLRLRLRLRCRFRRVLQLLRVRQAPSRVRRVLARHLSCRPSPDRDRDLDPDPAAAAPALDRDDTSDHRSSVSAIGHRDHHCSVRRRNMDPRRSFRRYQSIASVRSAAAMIVSSIFWEAATPGA